MRPIPHRGVTLVELLVALAASAIVLVGVLAAAKAQEAAYVGGQRVREAQGGARNALLFLEQKLQLAGYGMDPALALDLTGQPTDSDPTPWYTGPCPATIPGVSPCLKDRIDGSDELVFHARNPNYWVPPTDPPPAPGTTPRGRVWLPTQTFDPATSPNTLFLAGHAGDLFRKGQILQGVCNSGAGQLYVTVADNVGRTSGAGAQPVDVEGTQVQIPLMPEVLTNPFRRQSAGSCQPSRFFQIDRYRFHVRPVGVGAGYEGYLVLDMGIDANNDGNVDALDEQIIAPGVEVLQVAYHFTTNLDAVATTLAPAGDQAGVGIAISRGAPDANMASQRPSPQPPPADTTAQAIYRADFTSTVATDQKFYTLASLYEFPYGPPMAAERKTNYQANIRAVQVALVGRSTSPQPNFSGSLQPGVSSPVLNMNQAPAWLQAGSTTGRDGYERVRLDSTVNLPNLVARRLLFD